MGYFYSEENSVQLAIATGNELDKTLNADRVIETEFTDISLWGEYWPLHNLGIHYGVGFIDLDLPNNRSGNRKSVNIGLDYRF